MSRKPLDSNTMYGQRVSEVRLARGIGWPTPGYDPMDEVMAKVRARQWTHKDFPKGRT